MNRLSNRAYKSIIKSDFDSFLSILRDSHDIKSSYSSGVSNKNIEQSFLNLKNKEVMPLKILGAGGRGFILFYCQDKQKLIDNKINHLDFKII
jgi:D-glycero-alpha-D-manno-heptose-7-phosphate kinase